MADCTNEKPCGKDVGRSHSVVCVAARRQRQARAAQPQDAMGEQPPVLQRDDGPGPLLTDPPETGLKGCSCAAVTYTPAQAAAKAWVVKGGREHRYGLPRRPKGSDPVERKATLMALATSDDLARELCDRLMARSEYASVVDALVALGRLVGTCIERMPHLSSVEQTAMELAGKFDEVQRARTEAKGRAHGR